MNKDTRFLLKLLIPTVGICIPIITVATILKTGNYWSMLFLVWGSAVIFLQ